MEDSFLQWPAMIPREIRDGGGEDRTRKRLAFGIVDESNNIVNPKGAEKVSSAEGRVVAMVSPGVPVGAVDGGVQAQGVNIGKLKWNDFGIHWWITN
jgi:hypothetical protein